MKKICVLVAVLSMLLFLGPPCGSAQLESQGISILREAEQLSKKASSKEELEKALATYEQALEIFESTDSTPRHKGEVLENIGSIYIKLGEYQKALDCYEKALDIWRRIGDANRERVTLSKIESSRNNLGTRPDPSVKADSPPTSHQARPAKKEADRRPQSYSSRTTTLGRRGVGPIASSPPAPSPSAPLSKTPTPPMVAAMDVPPVAAPEFPWPPPRASASIKIPTSLVLGQWGAPAGSPPPRRTSWQSYYYGEDVLLSLWQTGAPRLMHVDATLTTALSAAGYLEASYYSVPDGFALVTRLEQINPDGTPKPVPTRWEAQARLLEKFSLTGYCQALFSAKPGLFRIIVFVVTSHPFTESPEIVTREDAILWLCRGANVLPSALAKQHYSAEHTCTALIYEFEKLDVETEAKVTVPGRLAADVHIEKSGIWGGIQR